MANPGDPGLFDDWIVDRISFGTAQPASGDTGTFDGWITDRIYFSDIVAAPAVAGRIMSSLAGPGGLAYEGGIAGPSGGLAG